MVQVVLQLAQCSTVPRLLRRHCGKKVPTQRCVLRDQHVCLIVARYLQLCRPVIIQQAFNSTLRREDLVSAIPGGFCQCLLLSTRQSPGKRFVPSAARRSPRRLILTYSRASVAPYRELQLLWIDKVGERARRHGLAGKTCRFRSSVPYDNPWDMFLSNALWRRLLTGCKGRFPYHPLCSAIRSRWAGAENSVFSFWHHFPSWMVTTPAPPSVDPGTLGLFMQVKRYRST